MMSSLMVAGLAAAAPLIALGTERWPGLAPCALCLWQRWPYWVAATLAVAAAFLPERLRPWLLRAAGVAVLVSGAIAVLHVGVEQGWWPSPLPACQAPSIAPGASGSQRWLSTLDSLDSLDFAVLVPGHGPVLHDHAGIAQTRDYLRWLRDGLQGAARRGLDMPEVLQLPVPERFRQLAVLNTEYERSVTHLYPAYELDTLPTIPRSKPK